MPTVPAASSAMLPPGFTAHTCVSVQCGICRADFGDSHDGPGVLHFDTVEEAADALGEAGWWVTTTGVQCDSCAARRACATFGHVWTAWRDCGCGCDRGEPRIPTHTAPSFTRLCETCHKWEWQEPA